MRIANVIEEGKLGGPQVRMVRVAAALGNVAETLIVMPEANSCPFREMCEAEGVAYRALPLTRITKEWRAAIAYLLFSPIEVLRLVRLFQRERIDVVHASGGSWQYKAVIAARLAGIPSAWHLNDTSMPGWVRRLFRLAAPLATAFIFASHRSKDYYSDLIAPGRSQAVVPSTVDTTLFDPAIHHPVDPDIPSDGTVIGTVANVNPIKGIETLIRCAANLRDFGHAPHVVIVGPIFDRQSGYHRRLLSLAEELGVAKAVHFIGGRSDVRPILKALDIYVCCSLSESSPLGVWEAMAMARPIVSTDVGDVPYHVTEGQEGYIIPVGDDAAMADRVSQLLKDPAQRARMGAAARNTAEIFGPKEIARKTLEVYSDLINADRSQVKNNNL